MPPPPEEPLPLPDEPLPPPDDELAPPPDEDGEHPPPVASAARRTVKDKSGT